MNQVKETLTGFYIGIGIYALMVEAIGIFFSEDLLAFTLGLLVGVIIAVFLTIHLAKTLDKALELPQEPAIKYMQRQSILRLFIMLFVLVIGLMLEHIRFIALVLGLFGRKIGALIAPAVLKRLYPESYATKQIVNEAVQADTFNKEQEETISELKIKESTETAT